MVLKPLKISFYKKYRVYNVQVINSFLKTVYKIPFKSQGVRKHFYENWQNPNPQTLRREEERNVWNIKSGLPFYTQKGKEL